MNFNMTSRWVCRNCRDGFRQQQHVLARQFSSTRPTQKAAIPKFKPTSSPELDAHLANIRSRVFVPAYLNKNQLKLVRSTKSKTQLENDPVFATFGDEEIRLVHLDITKDQPRKRAFMEFMDMAKDQKDWENLPALLEGWHHARPNLPQHWYTKMIVKANQAGMLPIIIQCLWQVESNGFTLSTPFTRYSIFQAIRINAVDSKWDKNVTEKCLKQIQTVLELMEKPGHCGGRIVSDSDPRAEAVVIGLPLELAAMRAKAAFEGKDDDGLVATYATRLITALGQQKSPLSDLNVEEVRQATAPSTVQKQVVQQLSEYNKLIQIYLPVRNGLKLAIEILGPTMAAESKDAANKYIKDIETKLDLVLSAAEAKAAEVPEYVGKGTLEGRSFTEWSESRGQ